MAVVRARPGPSILAGLRRAACRQAGDVRLPAVRAGRPDRSERPEPARTRRARQSPQGYGQGYAQQGGYTPPAYTVQDQAYGAQDRPYADQAYGDQAYQEQQGQPAPHWQAVSGLKPAGAGAKRSSDAKGFLGSLFDFSFTSFVTPKIVKVIYVLVTIWTVIWALIFLRFGFKYGGAAGGFFTLLVVDPILVVLTLGAYRMVLELFMVVHRMHEELKAIRERGES